MNWERIFVVLFCIFLIASISCVAFIIIKVEDERLSGCESLCEDRNMEYYTHDVDMKSGKATVFCSCLSEGMERKFVLVEESE